MKEINIGETLVTKRREKGITQDELASYMGVSKASVSKWETGQSYPDIVFLPQLATYFNISLDELMGYSPQMTKGDIKKLYKKLSAAFATQLFDEVIGECRNIIKKYYSCFPLLFQMAALLANHHMLAEDKKIQVAILEEAIGLCIRIKTESNDVWLSKDATSLEASCHLMLQQPQEVLNLLGESIRPFQSDDMSIAQAYQIMGNVTKAKEVTQISMYQHLIGFVGNIPSYLLLNADDSKKSEEILNRALTISMVYDLDHLHPNTMAQIYFNAAHVYSMQANVEKALDMIQKYADVCNKNLFPVSLHGDAFFDAIDSWLEELCFTVPRDEKVVRESILQSILTNPVFVILSEQPRFIRIVESLKDSVKN